MKIATKLILPFSLLFLAAIIVLALFIQIRESKQRIEREQRAWLEVGENMANTWNTIMLFTGSDNLARDQLFKRESDEIISINLSRNPKMNRIDSLGSPYVTSDLELQVLNIKSSVSQILREESGQYILTLVPLIAQSRCVECHLEQAKHDLKVGEVMGVITLKTSLEEIEAQITEGRNFVIISLTITLIIGIVIINYVVKKLTDPIIKLTLLSEKISNGDLEVSIDVPSNDEVGVLASSFNKMTTWLRESKKEIDENTKNLKNAHETLIQTNEELLQVLKVESELREQLVNAEKLASLGEMASKIAHEINNPLTIIMAQADLQLLEDNSAELRETFGQIIESAVQIQHLTRGYMDLGKPEQMKMSNIILGEVIRSTINALKPIGSLKYIKIKEEYIDNEPEIIGDASRLEQVFRNLLLNAVDATSNSIEKEIIVGTKLSEDGRSVDAFVSDSGVGIDPENLDKIFQHYFTTKKKGVGTGLGLVICKEITEIIHGGELTVQSTPGKGTLFNVLIPRAEYTKLKRKILIVDDEAYITDLFSQFFSGRGLIVRKANNGENALKIYETFSPDIVISDIAMPVMDGIELVDEIRKQNPDQRIILITGQHVDETTKEQLKNNHIPLLMKPIDLMNGLWDLISGLLMKGKNV
ncbi:MAG: response regulator [Candidatus Marinimicrobia bacterium]|nr:response regulator [Candidatus Neomarinimicrobiota bacterium]